MLSCCYVLQSFVVVDTILHRNKELSFTGTVDMDKVIFYLKQLSSLND